MTKVKICCMQSLDEARAAQAMGADAVGLVGAMPSGPGPIPDARIAEICAGFDGLSVLLTAEVQADDIIAHIKRCKPRAVQLVDRVAPREVARVRKACAGVQIIGVAHVNASSSHDEAMEVAAHADMLLLDSGSPNKAVKELGGTGRVHDWRISAEIVRESPVPVWLAGGLTPLNVTAAIKVVRPYGVDVCSGLRPKSTLDLRLLDQFMAAVRAA